MKQIYRVSKMLHEKEIELGRRSANDGVEALRQNTKPDTFLGRKTQEPFPKEEEQAR